MICICHRYFSLSERLIRMRALIVLLGIGLPSCTFATENIQTFHEFQSFKLIHEPSGVQQLPDGRFLVVEDESDQPMDVFSLLPGGQASESTLHRSTLFSWIRPNHVLGTLEDLEALAVDNHGYIYAITSHSRKENGKRSDKREQLARFKLDGELIDDFCVLNGLRKKIFKKHKRLKDPGKHRDGNDKSGFNIEGLSFDGSRQKLLFGLRSPLAGSDAIIVVLENPQAIFDREEPRFSDHLIKLDLDGGGIRALSYDPHLGGFLIISKKPGESPRLWIWNGDAGAKPERIRIPGILDLRQAEGVTPVKRDGHSEGILIVSDDGKITDSIPGHYLFLRYDQLYID